MTKFTQAKSTEANKEQYNDSVLPFWVAKTNTGYFTSIKLADETLNHLQEMIARKIKEGGKFVFKIRSTEPNEEGVTTANAWLEYMSPEKAAAWAASNKFTPAAVPQPSDDL